MRNSVIRHGSTNAQPIRISARLMLPFFPPSRHLSPLVVSLFHIFLSICAGNGLMRRDYTRCCDMRKHLRGKDRTIKSRVISRSQEFARGGLQLLTNALRWSPGDDHLTMDRFTGLQSRAWVALRANATLRYRSEFACYRILIFYCITCMKSRSKFTVKVIAARGSGPQSL